jgi:integrase
MGRFQRGHVYESFGAFHVRYYVTAVVDGKPVRRQKSERICANDARHKLECTKRGKCNGKCRSVQILAAEVMQGVNAQSGTLPETAVPISDFWEHTYLPHLKANVKASTLNGYQKIWEGHLSTVFACLTLKQYRTEMGTRFLTSLAQKGLGGRSIAHVKSLARAMFGHATSLGLIESNPWHDAKSLTKAKSNGGTHAYSLEQAEAIVNALADYPPCQLVFALAAFMGLRPGEVEALKWSDISDGWLHVRRSSWRGIVGTTKTEESVASVPLIEPVGSMVAAWRVQCGSPSDGWLFPSNRRDTPMILHGLVKRDIIPVLKKKNITWRGLYSGRRACATLLTQLTGDATAAQYVLRH